MIVVRSIKVRAKEVKATAAVIIIVHDFCA
jgi:hypothetical protein